MGFARVLFANSLKMITCPNCLTRLCYQSTSAPTIAGYLGLLATVLAGVVLLPRIVEFNRLVPVVFVGTFVLVLALQYSVRRYVYRTKRVELASEGSSLRYFVSSALATIGMIIVVLVMAYLFPA